MTARLWQLPRSLRTTGLCSSERAVSAHGACLRNSALQSRCALRIWRRPASTRCSSEPPRPALCVGLPPQHVATVSLFSARLTAQGRPCPLTAGISVTCWQQPAHPHWLCTVRQSPVAVPNPGPGAQAGSLLRAGSSALPLPGAKGCSLPGPHAKWKHPASACYSFI